MRTLMLMSVTLILIASWSVARTATAAEGRTRRTIHIELGKQVAALGERVIVKVEYHNGTDEPWRFPLPETSLGVQVHYPPIDAPNGSADWHTLGSARQAAATLPTGETITAIIMPVSSEVVLKSGESHVFTIDVPVAAGVTSRPGQGHIWIEDKNESLVSNKQDVEVVFAPESVPLLLEFVSQPSSSLMPWARDWLAKLKPDFTVKLPNYGKETSQEQRARESATQKAIANFRMFWSKEKDSDEIGRLFHQANGQSPK